MRETTTIAVYGDSFASCEEPYGWSYLLKKENPNTDIFAVPGTSIEWALEQFLNNHYKYHQNIFIVTAPGRRHVPIQCQSKEDGVNTTIEHWCGIDHLQWIIDHYSSKNNVLENFKEVLLLLKDQYRQYDINSHKAIVCYIKHIRPDTIIIPGFKTGNLNDDREINVGYDWCLLDLSNSENFKKPTGIKDTRCNHLSPENNKWVLNHIKTCIAQNIESSKSYIKYV
jgi:hypothetical protein